MAADKFLSGVIYGKSGTGKTTSLIGAFPRALMIGPRGCDTCASYYGISFDKRVQVIKPEPSNPKKNQGAKEVADILRTYEELFAKNNVKNGTILIPDLTIIAEYTYQKHLALSPGNKYKVGDAYNQEMMQLLDTILTTNAHVWVDMHEQDPRVAGIEGKTRNIPGGPKVSGWVLPESLPGRFEFVARVVHDPEIGLTWPFVYQTRGDGLYLCKDRYSVSPQCGRFPPNLGELMRAAGYDLPRAFAWMEAAVEDIATELFAEMNRGDGDIPAKLRELKPKFIGLSKDLRHIRWAFKDGLERALLRRSQAGILDGFFASATVTAEEAVEETAIIDTNTELDENG